MMHTDQGAVRACGWHGDLVGYDKVKDVNYICRGLEMDQLDDTVKTRDARYGGFQNVAAITQKFKTIMKCAPSYAKMTDVQKEGMEMVLHKCARLLSGDPAHRDSWHDIQGYAKLVEDRLAPEYQFKGTQFQQCQQQSQGGGANPPWPGAIIQTSSGQQNWPADDSQPLRPNSFTQDGT